MRTTLPSRAIATLALLLVTTVWWGSVAAAGAAEPEEKTTCSSASLPRARTEVDADLAVAQFDPALGTLLGVTVNGPSIVLDTDAKFENTAQSAVVFSETMTYQVVVSSPGGLGSPPPISGTITRVPSQTLAAFDGSLDYLGASAVTQAPTSKAESASTTSSTDAATLAAFTGGGTVPFHLTSTIGETFIGGGGNVQAEINTFLAASIEVCYRYAVPDQPPPPSSPPRVPPAAAPPPPVPGELPLTGRSTVPLTVAGVALIGAGFALVRRHRAPVPRFDA